MGEPTLSNQRETTFQACPTKPRRFGGRKAALLLGLATVSTVVFFFVFLTRTTTPPQPTMPTEQAARRTNRIDPQEQAYWDGIARELIAEGTLTPDHPASPEAQQAKPATPITPAERIELYERYVLDLLN